MTRPQRSPAASASVPDALQDALSGAPAHASDDADPASRPEARHLFGFTVHPAPLHGWVELARDSAVSRRPVTVLYHNLHSLYLWYRDAELRRHYAGRTVLVDGMPLIALLRLAGVNATRDHRVTYVDLIMPLLEMARDNSLKVFHVGQSADVQARALDEVRRRLPGIDIHGHDGYFDQSARSTESLEVIRAMNEYGSDLVLVGFGTPRQEAWLHAHRAAIDAPAVYACGACMEYVAGEVATPPRWMGRAGLEWAFRLGENPRRFAFRYLIEPLVLATRLGGEIMAGRLRKARPDASPQADDTRARGDRAGA